MHGPGTRIDDLFALSGRFSRVPAAVTAIDRRPGRGSFLPAADATFPSVFVVPSEGGTGSAEAPAATLGTQHSPSSTIPSQGADVVSIANPAPFAPSPPRNLAPQTALPPSGHISTRKSRRTAAVTRIALTAVIYGLGSRGAPRPSARRANTLPRVPLVRTLLAVFTAHASAASPVPTVLIPSYRGRAEPVAALLFPPPLGVPSATTAD